MAPHFGRWIFGAALVYFAPLVRAESVLHGFSFATTTFSVDAGLPSNVVQAVVQTRDGYLWVGTEGGLARFDGVRFQVFRHRDVPALADNLIRCLLEDRAGNLWIGTQAGLSRYANGRFERIGAFDKAIGAVAEDAEGSIWIGVQNAGLWRYQEGTLVPCADGKLMKPTDSPLRVFADSLGRVWAAIDRGPLVYWRDGALHESGLPTAELRQTNRIIEFPRGILWFASQAGLFRLQGNELRPVGRSRGLGAEVITDLFPDHAGRLWAAARILWVAEHPDAGDFEPLPNVRVEYSRYMTQDREGTYWIGSSGEGLARLRMSAFHLASNPDGSSLNRLRSVTAAPDGSIWFASGPDPRGVARFAPDGTLSFVPVGQGADAEISAICAARDGGVWLAARGSLALWRQGKIERFPAYQNVRALFQSKDGTMWVGLGAGGVVSYQNGQFTALALAPGVATSTPTAFAQAPGGAIYLGFITQGVMKLEGGQLTRLAGLPAEEIRALHADAEGRLWVGLRRRGLAIWDHGLWLNPEELVELFSERVSAINEDGRGNIWLGTMRGIIWGTKEDFLAVAHGASSEGRFHFAGPAQGVRPGVIGFGTQPSSCNAGDTLWFAGRDGLVAVRPELIVANPVPPPVRIESVTIDGKREPAGAELRLPPGVRSLAINYTALSFVQPSRVLFRYRLDGSDQDWVHADERRVAYYNNLRPGRHEFRVLASNEDGVWNEAGATLLIQQEPWFYQTWWFYVLALVATGSAAAGMYFWRTAGLRTLVARQTEQIRRQAEKEAELHRELERTTRLESLGILAGGIAHDFNNLLTVIMANIGLAKMDQRVELLAGDTLRDAEQGAKSAAELTQQLLTFAKGGDPVRRAVALPDVVREAAGFARHGTQVRCEFQFAEAIPPANADRGQISRVIHNLVLNAAQAMPEGGVVQIRLASEQLRAGEIATLPAGNYVRLSVSDHGRGIAPENLPRIFDPYFSTKSKNHGLGLATVHSIVKKHRGHVSVTSTVERGTRFDIWLPTAVADDAASVTVKVTAKNTGRPLRILFMDDEEVIRRAAQHLIKHLGHDGVFASEGSAAVSEYQKAMANGNAFDVVVLDLTVPGGMGGKATMEALRALDPNVTAIVSSGYSSDPVIANYRAYGFAAVVPKPYNVEEFAKAIRDVT